MRLTNEQRQIIHDTALEAFGPGASVRLFGSRVDERARGGDIDLLVTAPMQNPAEVVRAEMRFQALLQQRLGEQKIDVLVDYPGRRERPPIFNVAERTGIPL
ncbi:conserved hypothetical protein [Thioalkalivibrio sp. K90mix]|jgi:predicted nucleotidyltransferase|uniref:nucleotidyltransferase domain-containing protein n=1 Tax=unclassified Thioalkalivibrio TaxID=2621013 RepID=UPI000195A502|nr:MULTISPECIES: nucleotidyltransferase domain-containing protein [unclassified Thioalkalivibrio]ADC72309.1 conserved hypothetical protein [Thioalkalivibrio sp. K90mix]